MGKHGPQKATSIQSHIQMPKLLLKRFHNENNRFYYYDVAGKFIGNKGTAESTNTEFGYYSVDTENYLSDNIETPFGKILAYIDSLDFTQEYFAMPFDFEQSTRAFIYSLLSRDPAMVSTVNKHSVFLQFLPKQSRNDFTAIIGILQAKQNDPFAEYFLTFMVNHTEVPFPIAGLYSYSINGHSIINLPISPNIAICLVHKGYAKHLMHDNGMVSMFMVELPVKIIQMNIWAFISQKKRNWGRIICPSREELARLVDNNP